MYIHGTPRLTHRLSTSFKPWTDRPLTINLKQQPTPPGATTNCPHFRAPDYYFESHTSYLIHTSLHTPSSIYHHHLTLHLTFRIYHLHFYLDFYNEVYNEVVRPLSPLFLFHLPLHYLAACCVNIPFWIHVQFRLNLWRHKLPRRLSTWTSC